MAFPVKPATKPDWTATNAGARTEPSPSYKNTGWFSNLRPPYQFMNWLFYNIGVEWLNYFDSAIDNIKSVGFSIGTGGDFATINAAIASSSVVPGSILTMLESQTLAVTQVISKANIELRMGPGIVLSDGGAGTGIQISAARCRIRGGKMAGFTTAAMAIDAGSDYTMIGEMLLQGNNADLADANGKTATYGVINE